MHKKSYQECLSGTGHAAFFLFLGGGYGICHIPKISLNKLKKRSIKVRASFYTDIKRNLEVHVELQQNENS